MTRKDIIINYYLNNQDKSLDLLSCELDVSKGRISNVITEYIESLPFSKKLGFCFSLSFPNSLGYLFDDCWEREVIIESNEILNKNDFTQHELLWLRNNFALGNKKETEKTDYLRIAKDEVKQSILKIKPNKKVVAYLELL